MFQGAGGSTPTRLLHGPLSELLWVARLVLIAAVVLHVVAAWQLTGWSRAARPVGYRGAQPQVSTLASRTMRWGGVLLLVFLVFHVLHFTSGHRAAAGRSSRATRTTTSSGSFRTLVGDAVLCHRDGRAWPPSVPRRLERRADAWARPAPPTRCTPLAIALALGSSCWLGFP